MQATRLQHNEISVSTCIVIVFGCCFTYGVCLYSQERYRKEIKHNLVYVYVYMDIPYETMPYCFTLRVLCWNNYTNYL